MGKVLAKSRATSETQHGEIDRCIIMLETLSAPHTSALHLTIKSQELESQEAALQCTIVYLLTCNLKNNIIAVICNNYKKIFKILLQFQDVNFHWILIINRLEKMGK